MKFTGRLEFLRNGGFWVFAVITLLNVITIPLIYWYDSNQEPYTPTLHFGKVQSVNVVVKQDSKETGGGNHAFAGAVIGSLFGAPTIGALVGASKEIPRQVAIIHTITGCRFSVENGGAQYYFSTTYSGYGAEKCALLSPGDMVQIEEFVFKKDTYKNCESNMRWQGMCLDRGM